MNRYFPIFCLILLLVVISACSPMTAATQEPAPSLQPTPSQAYHPLTTRTGNEAIDNMLNAVASEDIQMLRSLIQFTNAKCTWREGLGGPPKCREGEAEGTSLEVLPFLGSEGSYYRSDEIQNWPGIQALGIYAIYEVASDVVAEEYSPVGEYAIIFVSQENQLPVTLRIADGKIVRVDYVFDNSPAILDSLIQREASTVILAPLSQ